MFIDRVGIIGNELKDCIVKRWTSSKVFLFNFCRHLAATKGFRDRALGPVRGPFPSRKSHLCSSPKTQPPNIPPRIIGRQKFENSLLMYRSKNINEFLSRDKNLSVTSGKEMEFKSRGKRFLFLVISIWFERKKEREKKYGRKRKKRDNLDANGDTTLLESNWMTHCKLKASVPHSPTRYAIHATLVIGIYLEESIKHPRCSRAYRCLMSLG